MTIEHYPNGQIKSDVPQLGPDEAGVVRHWHDDGSLQSEVPMLGNQRHGVCRQWNRAGKLIHECHYDHGSGIARSWHDNGQLKSELPMVRGVPHGKQRVWDESGEALAEAYYLQGQKVSKKKFIEALGHPAAKTPAAQASYPAQALTTSRLIPGVLPAGARDAAEWLSEASTDCQRTLGELSSGEQSLSIVKDLLAAGATRVWAVDIDCDGASENSGRLLIEMPGSSTARKRVLKKCNQMNGLQGFEPEPDTGQTLLSVALD